MRRYYLGLNAGGPKASKCLFTHGSFKDLSKLTEYLSGRYQGATMLTKNGRSALALALKSYFNKGDGIIVTGFTCFAVYEAVKAAGMVPVFVDIDTNLNPSDEALTKAVKTARGIIIQNTLGNPVDIKKIEKFAKEHGLTIIEDLAHSVGVKYPDGREAGTVGAAVALSFGKDKSINTISGGAVILREAPKHEIKAPFKAPRTSDYLRARFYPMFCAICRGLNHIHLGGIMMRGLIKIHFVEKSADSKLDLTRRLAKFQAKMALEQIKTTENAGAIREFYLVENRAEVLKKLRGAGYFFDAFWYERPVSPERYYKKVKFPEAECPNATKVAAEIINFPIYYKKSELEKAKKIIEPYLTGGKNA